MSRKLINQRFLRSDADEQYTVLQFTDRSEFQDRHGSGLRRVDTFETDDGFPVLLTGCGRYSALIVGEWLTLNDSEDDRCHTLLTRNT